MNRLTIGLCEELQKQTDYYFFFFGIHALSTGLLLQCLPFVMLATESEFIGKYILVQMWSGTF